ncbi:Rieske (2Fe-2S) protein [Isoalcanivorax beigongshangi]|uniref:Rieske (2Fe-2S) protein n=1 Tax=Isoalcanivorax beigongshangi TaxID=3238810 RepID=A0ABV4AK89_9GAMM
MSEVRLCARNELEEGAARGFQLGAHSVLAVVQDGQLHTYWNWCPHLGIELNFMPDQFLDDQAQFITCANHGALFEIESGECVSGPCHGEKLVAITHDIRDGDVWITLENAPA